MNARVLPLYVPQASYRLADADGYRWHIVQNGRAPSEWIATTNPYNPTSAGACQRLIDAANKSGEYLRALKELAAAVITLESAMAARGQWLPEPVVEAKAKALRVMR
jgi:hypothetical protein